MELLIACRRGPASECTRTTVMAAQAAARQAAAPPGEVVPGMCRGMEQLCDAYYGATAFQARHGAQLLALDKAGLPCQAHPYNVAWVPMLLRLQLAPPHQPHNTPPPCTAPHIRPWRAEMHQRRRPLRWRQPWEHGAPLGVLPAPAALLARDACGVVRRPGPTCKWRRDAQVPVVSRLRGRADGDGLCRPAKPGPRGLAARSCTSCVTATMECPPERFGAQPLTPDRK